jgi:hypothetical protein
VNQAEEEDSLDTKVKQLMAYASSRGLYLLQSDVYIEKGVSDGQEVNSRPEGSKLLAI